MGRAAASRQTMWNAGAAFAVLCSMEGFEGIGLGGFSLATILVAVLFGLVGFAAFRYGRKNNEPRPLFLGIALMAYGYFVTNAWISFGIGALLTLLLFFPR